MRLPRDLYDRIKAHALAEAPQECCGIVGLAGDIALSVHPAANVAENPQLGYLMDADDQRRILSGFDGLRHTTTMGIAIYHSHPMGGAEPSLRDLRQAAYPDAIYLIIGMRQGLVTRAWQFGHVARPVALEVIE